MTSEAPFKLSPEFEALSYEAKAVGGAWFGAMRPNSTSHLNFGMIERRPTAVAQAALDELEAAGLIERISINRPPAITYRPTAEFGPLLYWAFNKPKGEWPDIPLVEPIPGVEQKTPNRIELRRRKPDAALSEEGR